MKIAIIGNNDGPERLAAALELSQHQVVLIAQQKEARPLVPRVVENEQSLERALDGLDVDLIINCFANFKYRYLHRSHRILNIHLAPLPKYRGRHPLQWALINGETKYGVTIHEINDDWDDGPIYWQKMIDVREGWSARELREALFVHVEHDIVALLEELPTLEPIVNNASEGSYIPRRGPADSLIEDWADRGHVFRKIMALRDDAHPAFAYLDGQKIDFLNAFRLSVVRAGKPGVILGGSLHGDLLVATAGEHPIVVVPTPKLPQPLTGKRFTARP